MGKTKVSPQPVLAPPVFLPETAGFHAYHELPFSLTPNPRYLHIGTQHRSAIAKSLYLVEHRQGLTFAGEGVDVQRQQGGQQP